MVVANSQPTPEHYRRTRFGTRTPIRVIPNGTDESRLRDHSETSLRSLIGANPRDAVFTLIGRVNTWKGHHVFIEAAERLVAEAEDVRFLIVGDSFAGQEHLSEAVDRRIESSSALRGRIIRLPHTSHVGAVYEASDVIVVPSTQPEAFGLVAVEAMAAGLPVIASRIGALPELVVDGRTGLLFTPNDPSSLAAAMKELSGSRAKRAEMGRAGRKRFEDCYRVGKYVEQFSGVYEQLFGLP